jgi:hypothetical protein
MLLVWHLSVGYICDISATKSAQNCTGHKKRQKEKKKKMENKDWLLREKNLEKKWIYMLE